MRVSSIVWGLVLVLLGGLLLLDNMNMLPPGLNVWAIFWPLVLILLGIAMLLGVFRVSQHMGTRYASGEALRLPLDGARTARVRIQHGAGELMIDDRAGQDELINGTFSGGLEHKIARDGDSAALELRAPVGSFPVILPFDPSSGFHWTVGLNPAVPLELNLELGASRNRIDLRNLMVKRLSVKSGASSTEIDFPAHAGQTFAKVETGAASVEIRIPQGVAARIRSSSGLSGVTIDTHRFPGGSGSFRSPDYDTAANRLELELDTGVGSIRVR
jgi:hypothetical protein